MKKKYLVVGSGLFGAVFAHEAAKRGNKVTVIEQRDHLAGNIYTKEVDGIQVHQYGAHIFHTSDKKVWDYVQQFAEFNRYTNAPVANYYGKMYNLPFNMNTFSEMWGVRTPQEAMDKINEQQQEMAGKEPQNLEEQAISLIGRDIYEKLIKSYTEKQWGRKATELPAFIIKRLPVRLTYDNNYFNDDYQGIPKGGYTQIVEKMLDDDNIEVKLNKKDKTTKYKKPVYVSLYGLSNISEIKNKIALSLIKNKKIKQLMPVLDVGIEIGSDLVSKNTFIQNSDSKLNRIIKAFHKIDNLIIFFDDLERCNININAVLGYINELVEHNNIKVILVADESKIGKVNFEKNVELKYMIALSDKIKYSSENKTNDVNKLLTKEEIIKRTKQLFDKDKIYGEMKEKLIGKIVYYRANIEDVYNVFVNNIITNQEAKETAIRIKEKILKQFEDNNYYNLRTLQFIFQAFNRIVDETISIIDLEDIKYNYLNDLLSYCTIKAIKLKQGENTYNWEQNQKFGTVYLGNKISDYIYKNFVVGFKFVDDYLLNSHLDKAYIKETLSEYKKITLNENNNPNDPLYKLKTWWLISEKELSDIIDDLIIKIKDNDYDLEMYSKIVSYLSRIEEMDVCVEKIKIAIKRLEKNISENKVNGQYCEERLFDGTKETVEIYNKNIMNIKKLVDKKEIDDNLKDLNDIYESYKWGELFKEYCEKNNGKFLNQKHFADALNIDFILSNIKDKDIEQVYEFWYSLQKIYNFSNIKEYYENDKEILINLKNSLSQIDNIDKVKKFVVNKIIDFLEQVIELL